jgi:transketolase
VRSPVYLRLCRQPGPELHAADHDFRPGRPDVLHQGEDLAVLTMGAMAAVVLDALPRLDPTPTVVNVSSLPVDADAVRAIAQRHQKVFVVEDHHVVGGLADEIARCLLAMPRPPRWGSWGVPDYGQSGSPAELYDRYRLDARGIADVLRNFADPT